MKVWIGIFILFSLCQVGSATIETDLGVYCFSQDGVEYAEVYTRISAKSLTWVKDSSGASSAAVDLLYILREVEGDTLYADKVLLAGNKEETDLIEVKRIILKPGKYELLLSASDTKLANSIQSLVYPFEVNGGKEFRQSSLLVSGIQKPCKETKGNCKNGVEMEPLPWLISQEENSLVYLYNEIYASDKVAKSFYIAYGIRTLLGQEIATRYKKYNGESVIICNLPFDVSGLISGDYSIFLEVYNVSKEMLSSKSIYFTKSNPMADMAVIEAYNSTVDNSWVQSLSAEDLRFDLKSIWPLVSKHRAATLDRIISSKKLRLQRHFLHKFWTERGGSQPEQSYRQFREVAKAVDKRFYNAVGYGTETDRGYIYLKYGKPNDIVAVEDEPTAPPYQIWRYNYIVDTKQSNVKFIFYNQSLVSNDFVLLHSTCRGELQNPAWELELYRRAPWDQEGNTIDSRTVSDNFSRNARRLFEDL